MPARVLLADDHTLVRAGLRRILDDEPDLTVVAEAEDGAEAVVCAQRHDIDLAILDISMPKLTGLQAARRILEYKPEVRVLMLSMHDNEEFLFESLRVGAVGYVLKSSAEADLVGACRTAMRDEPFLYPKAVGALVRDYLGRVQRGELPPVGRVAVLPQRQDRAPPHAGDHHRPRDVGGEHRRREQDPARGGLPAVAAGHETPASAAPAG